MSIIIRVILFSFFAFKSFEKLNSRLVVAFDCHFMCMLCVVIAILQNKRSLFVPYQYLIVMLWNRKYCRLENYQTPNRTDTIDNCQVNNKFSKLQRKWQLKKANTSFSFFENKQQETRTHKNTN